MDVAIQTKLDATKALLDAEELFQRLTNADKVARALVIPTAFASELAKISAQAGQVQAALNAVNAALNNTRTATASTTSAVVNQSVAYNALSQNVGMATAAQVQFVVAQQAATNALRAANASQQAANGQGGSFAATMGNLTNRAAQLALAYISVRTAMRLVSEITEARVEMDRLDIGLKSVAPSAAEAAQAQAFLINRTQMLGLTLQSTVPEFVKMSAAFTQSGMSFSQTEKVFSDLAVATKALGLTSATTGRILYDFQEMISLGSVQLRQLRQVLMQMPGGLEIAARAMGVTTEEFHRLVKEGLIEPTEFVQKFSAELANTFGKTLPEATDTLESHINRLKNSWTLLLAEMGKSPAFKGTVDLARDVVDSAYLASNRLFTGADLNRKFPNAQPFGTPVTNVDAQGSTTTTHPDYQQTKLWPWSTPTEDPNAPDMVAAYRRMQGEQAQHDLTIGAYADSLDSQFGGGRTDLNDKQLEAKEKLLELTQAIHREELTGLQKEYAQIDLNAERQADQMRKLYAQLPNFAKNPEEQDNAFLDIQSAATAAKQIAADKAAAAEQKKDDELNRKNVEQITDAYKRLNEVRHEGNLDALNDADQAVQRENDRYEKQQQNLTIAFAELAAQQGIVTALTAQAGLWDLIAKGHSNQLNKIREQYSVSFVGENTLMDLERKRIALQNELLNVREGDPDGEKEGQRLQRQIEAINRAITLKLKTGNAGMFDSFNFGFQNVADNWGSTAEKMAITGKTLAESMDTNMTNALTGIILGTKSVGQAFQEMSANIIADLVKVAVEEFIVRNIISAFGGIGGGAAAGGAKSLDAGNSLSGVGIGHTGGWLGVEGLPHVSVPTGIFAGAPRYHSGGVTGDEMPIVAKRKEGVFTEGQMKALGLAINGGGKSKQPIHIINIADPAMVDERLAANPDAVLNVIARNAASVRRLLK